MADQHNTNIPAMANQISADIPDIKENLEFHKDAFQLLFETWSDTDNSSNVADSALGWSDGTYTYDFPTNGVAGNAIIMLGNSSTIVWMYVNTAPPGWKVTTTGKGTVLSVSDTTGTSNGTTDGTTADKLVDSGADFVTDAVVVGDTVYNTTDATAATVTAIDDLNTLAIDEDIFVSGEGYIVGKAYVEAGGRQTEDGSWTVSGITAASESTHTHTGPSHTHNAPYSGWSNTAGYTAGTLGIFRGTDNVANLYMANAVKATSAAGTGASGAGAAHTHTVTEDGIWRPTASIGKLYQLDTA